MHTSSNRRVALAQRPPHLWASTIEFSVAQFGTRPISSSLFRARRAPRALPCGCFAWTLMRVLNVTVSTAWSATSARATNASAVSVLPSVHLLCASRAALRAAALLRTASGFSVAIARYSRVASAADPLALFAWVTLRCTEAFRRE